MEPTNTIPNDIRRYGAYTPFAFCPEVDVGAIRGGSRGVAATFRSTRGFVLDANAVLNSGLLEGFGVVA